MSLADQHAKITADLTTIRELWPEMLPRIKAIPLGQLGGGSARTSTAKAADNGDHNADVDNLDIVISDRGDITAVLQGWARVVVEDFDVTTVIPHGHDVQGMCTFLERWARHMTGHEAADDFAGEIHECYKKVLKHAKPRGRDWVWIGDCPVTKAENGERVVCGEPIKVWSGRPIKCKGCQTEDTVDGWTARITGETALVTADQLIPLLHKRLGINATPKMIHHWIARGVITPAEKRRVGRSTVSMFDRFDVFAALTYKESAS